MCSRITTRWRYPPIAKKKEARSQTSPPSHSLPPPAHRTFRRTRRASKRLAPFLWRDSAFDVLAQGRIDIRQRVLEQHPAFPRSDLLERAIHFQRVCYARYRACSGDLHCTPFTIWNAFHVLLTKVADPAYVAKPAPLLLLSRHFAPGLAGFGPGGRPRPSLCPLAKQRDLLTHQTG